MEEEVLAQSSTGYSQCYKQRFTNRSVMKNSSVIRSNDVNEVH